MITKFRILLAICLLAFMAMTVATAVQAHNGRIVKLTPGTYLANDDSSNTTTFTLRKSGDVGADKDTSDIYDMVNIEHLVIQLKGSPKLDGVTRAVATALDSGAVTCYVQGSNYSTLYFKDIDTLTAADSLAVGKETWFKERTFRYIRFRFDTGTKSDDSGVSVQLKMNVINR